MRYSYGWNPSRQMTVMRIHVAAAIIALAWLGAQSARAAEDKSASKPEELDVTMQIISDPNAKRPDEIIRRIPLPVPKTESKAQSNANRDSSSGQENKGQERADAAKELGSEMSDRAKERAQNAAEQREEARHSQADDHRQTNNPHPPPSPPGRPPRPPGH